MITRDLPHTESAFDEESYEYLETNYPTLLMGVIEDVSLHNATPADIRRFIRNRYGRDQIAARCEQAARHYLRVRSNGS